MLSYLITLLSLRNIVLLFCLLNVKNLPLVWELRLFYRAWRSWKSKREVARLLERASSSYTAQNRAPASSHPIFLPLTISSITPMLEIDHNLHKSNSTYFSDLDESRTALMFSPAELEREGYKGPFSVILGAVHTSFLKEIKPYETYQVRSRILGWDEKWILIGSVFVRPKNEKDRTRERKDLSRRAKISGKSEDELKKELTDGGHGEVLLASCLSKYVVKKGRFTVPPERCWRSAGWLPEKPAGQASPLVALDSSSAPTPDTETVIGEIKITEETLRRRAQETAAGAAEKLRQVQGRETVQISQADEACKQAASRWSWDDIEAERARGMRIAENWLGLDKGLKELWETDRARGIVP
ncbi:hypothetical protein LTS08_004718 [Lithohypha guttulata]|nr:hypothetical protein LTS08_004718 [Lithohypha guttulata]